MIFSVSSYLSLLNHIPLVLFSFQLLQIMWLYQLSKIIMLVVIHRLFNFVLHVRRNHRHHKVIERFEYISLLLQVVVKKSISILAIQNHLLIGHPTKFKNLQQLVIIILPRKDRNFDKHFNSCTSKWPHIDTLVIKWCWR